MLSKGDWRKIMSVYEISQIKITKKEYLNEVIRVAKLLNVFPIAPRAEDYNKHCKMGYHTQRVQSYIQVSYTDAVKLSGLNKRPKNTFKLDKVTRGKIRCGNITIQLNECVPGNRPDCHKCEGMERAKIKAIKDVSDEEAKTLAINTSRHLNGYDGLYDMTID